MKPLPIKGLLPIAILCTAILVLTIHNEKPLEENENEEVEEFEKEETGPDKQLAMWFHARAYPDPYNLNNKFQAAWETFLESRKKENDILTRTNRTSSANWSYIGPNNTIGGRVLCITIDPANSNNLWAGSASGGMWKSTNAGTSWSYVPISNVPVLGVSSIIINPSNSNIMYAGTGEVYRTGNSNIGFNVWKARGTYGVGILKSTDGGINWTQVLVKSTPDMFAVQMLEFDPSNSNTILAAATDGLYRTTDAGTNWTKILNKTYVADVAIHPTISNNITVSVGNLVDSDKGVYYTTDGGSNWFAATGLPAFSGFIRLDNTSSSNLFASVGIGSGNEIYQSTNFGQTWTVNTNSTHCSFQYWFAHDLAVNPFTTDSLTIAGVSGYRYRVSTSGKSGAIPSVHSDMHDIEYDPVYRGRIYIACDGGIYRSTNGGVAWSNMNTGLAATQFYASLGISSLSADLIIGGLQDNGQVIYNGSTWTTVGWIGGDGTTCAIDPGNDNNMLFSRDARAVYRSTNGGTGGSQVASYWGFDGDSRTAFVAPLSYSKSNTSVVYLASDNLHKSVNGGASFTNSTLGATPPYPAATPTNFIEQMHKTAIALAVSPTNENKVYVSTSPFAQFDNDVDNLYVTGNPNVLRTTTGSTPFTSIKGTLPDRFLMDFAISPTNDDSVFVVMGGFEDGGGSHIFVTGNGGTTWTDIGSSGILPDVPFNAILIDPINPQIIYAGCDFGVYVSPDRGSTWQDYNNGFTGTNLVMDLQMSFDNLVVAATHGRGVATSPRFSGTLPVFFSSFKGVHQPGINKLEWKTTNESNLLRFELEKSTDGRTFIRIANFNPRNLNGSYTYSHNDAVNASVAVYYYRVKAIELDGTYKYSPVVSLQVNGKKQFQVLNNPFTDYITVTARLEEKQTVNINLFDAQGRLVKQKQFAGEAGSNTFIVDQASGLTKGMYMLEAIINRQRYTEKLLKN